jgi:hypothetical protein
MTSCSDAEDGEDWSSWEMRNMLDSKWSIDRVMVNGEWTYGVFSMNMKLKAEGRTFEATRFFYKDDEKDDATEVKKTGTFTIDEKNNVVEATDSDGNKFFRMVLKEKVTSSIHCDITFYDINKTYEVLFSRSW